MLEGFLMKCLEAGGAIAGLGAVLWVASHLMRQTIPSIVTAHNEQMAAERTACSKERQEQREIFTDTVKEITARHEIALDKHAVALSKVEESLRISRADKPSP